MATRHEDSASRAVRVNGEMRVTTAATLAELLTQLGYVESAVATSVNEQFVPRQVRSHTQLQNEDRVEIVAPRQGG